VYADADVTRLRLLGALVEAGHPIGSIARLPDTALVDLLSAVQAAKPAAAGASFDLDRLVGALESGELLTVESALTQWAAILPPRELVFQVIAPSLHRVGERWAAGGLHPWQEHAVSASMRSVLGSLVRIVAHPTGSPRVIFATPSGERHEMGLLCAALLAAARGLSITYLGPDLPGSDIAAATSHLGAALVVLSTTYPNEVADADLPPLAALPPEVQIWIGGAGGQVPVDRLAPRAVHITDLESFDRRLQTWRATP
jgi:hypothetical protein